MSHATRWLTTEQVWITRLFQLACRDGKIGNRLGMPSSRERTPGLPAAFVLRHAAETRAARLLGEGKRGPASGRSTASERAERVPQTVSSDV